MGLLSVCMDVLNCQVGQVMGLKASSPFLLLNATGAQCVKTRFLQQSVQLFGAKMPVRRQYLVTRGK